MNNQEIKNAIIESTTLGFEGHGILSCMFYMAYDGGSSSQGYGGYNLRGSFCSDVIEGILKALDEDKWEDLKGMTVRVKRENGWGGKIIAIGHIVKDTWFSFEETRDKKHE